MGAKLAKWAKHTIQRLYRESCRWLSLRSGSYKIRGLEFLEMFDFEF